MHMNLLIIPLESTQNFIPVVQNYIQLPDTGTHISLEEVVAYITQINVCAKDILGNTATHKTFSLLHLRYAVLNVIIQRLSEDTAALVTHLQLKISKLTILSYI
jgi:hypothetical protein